VGKLIEEALSRQRKREREREREREEERETEESFNRNCVFYKMDTRLRAQVLRNSTTLSAKFLYSIASRIT